VEGFLRRREERFEFAAASSDVTAIEKATKDKKGKLVMADENTGKKPDDQGGSGAEKGADAGEAGGRSRQLLYTCFNDGAGNYIDPSWKWFTCWRCGALNYT
jgi:hypothetical protein